MKTKNIKTHLPFVAPKPQNMMPLEQIFCMVYLAQTCSIEELRKKQDIIEQQIKLAHHHHLTTEDLLATQDNLSAAVAYQSFPDHNVWMSFIRLK